MKFLNSLGFLFWWKFLTDIFIHLLLLWFFANCLFLFIRLFWILSSNRNISDNVLSSNRRIIILAFLLFLKILLIIIMLNYLFVRLRINRILSYLMNVIGWAYNSMSMVILNIPRVIIFQVNIFISRRVVVFIHYYYYSLILIFMPLFLYYWYNKCF